VRATAGVLAAAAAIGCHPSATVERTMPVANLQSFHTIGLRVRSTAFAAQGLAVYLQNATVDKLQRQCQFDQVGLLGNTPTDVVLDLNITNSARGGTGWVRNDAQANIDTLLVLTDGQSGELLGTARIHGQSSGIMMNGAAPETEAIEEISKSVAGLLAKSGCSGPRVAKAEPPPQPPPPGPGSAGVTQPPGPGSAAATPPQPGVDESKRPEADALNDQGRDKLQRADLAGALASFQQANAMIPDARYEFNVCLTFEAMEQWDNAIAACKQARAMNPAAHLVTKIDHRLELLSHHQ
jgi:hypothetical protein